MYCVFSIILGTCIPISWISWSYPYKLSYINTYFFKNKPIIELYVCDAIIIKN